MGLIFRARAELVSWIKVRTRKLSGPKDDDKIGIFCAERRKALKRDFPRKIKWGGRESNFYSPSGARSLILRFPNGHIFRGVEPGRELWRNLCWYHSKKSGILFAGGCQRLILIQLDFRGWGGRVERSGPFVPIQRFNILYQNQIFREVVCLFVFVLCVLFLYYYYIIIVSNSSCMHWEDEFVDG